MKGIDKLRDQDLQELLPYLPPIIIEMKACIGWLPTLKLVEVSRGCPFFAPSRFRPDLPMVKLIGERATLKLIEQFAGERFDMPKLHIALLALRNREIARKYHEGRTCRQLALEYDLTERQVWSILAAAGTASCDNQYSLFKMP